MRAHRRSEGLQAGTRHHSFPRALWLLVCGVSGCTFIGDAIQDRCEVLCRDVGDLVAECQPFGLAWSDFGADDETDFTNQCQAEWGRERLELTASDLRRALDDCELTRQALEEGEVDCQEYLALVGLEL